MTIVLGIETSCDETGVGIVRVDDDGGPAALGRRPAGRPVVRSPARAAVPAPPRRRPAGVVQAGDERVSELAGSCRGGAAPVAGATSTGEEVR